MRCITFLLRGCLWSSSWDKRKLSQGPADNSVVKSERPWLISSPTAGRNTWLTRGDDRGQAEFGFSTLMSFQYSPNCLAFTVID